MRLPLLTTLLLAGASATAARVHAQAAAPIKPWRPQWTETHPSPMSTMLQLPGGDLEVLGLNRWTPTAIQDSLDRKAIGESIASHACAAALRYRLGFAEAVAVYFGGGDSAANHVVVAVIEPQDSTLVRHRRLPFDTTTAHRQAPWASVVDLAATRPMLLTQIVRTRLEARLAGKVLEVPSQDLADSTTYAAIWSYLDAHADAKDLADARRILTTAPYIFDRVAALALLSNFTADDAIWRELVGALLEPDGLVRLYAGQTLAFLTAVAPRPVDWTPAAQDLHAIFSGSSLYGLTDVMKALVATKAPMTLAPSLLKGGGHAVLMYAGAQNPAFREPALAFLRQMSGQDFGKDVAKWQAWIGAL